MLLPKSSLIWVVSIKKQNMLWNEQSQQNNSKTALALCCCLRVNISSTLQSKRKKRNWKITLKKSVCLRKQSHKWWGRRDCRVYFEEDFGVFFSITSLPHSPPKQWNTLGFVWKLKILTKQKKALCAFLKTVTKSMKMLFLTNGIKIALTPSALPKLELSERLFLKFRKCSCTLREHHK